MKRENNLQHLKKPKNIKKIPNNYSAVIKYALICIHWEGWGRQISHQKYVQSFGPSTTHFPGQLLDRLVSWESVGCGGAGLVGLASRRGEGQLPTQADLQATGDHQQEQQAQHHAVQLGWVLIRQQKYLNLLIGERFMLKK